MPAQRVSHLGPQQSEYLGAKLSDNVHSFQSKSLEMPVATQVFLAAGRLL